MVLLRSHNLDDKHFAGRMLQQTYRFVHQVLAADTSSYELKGLLDPTMFQPIAKKLFVNKPTDQVLSTYENSIRYELAAYSATLNRGDMENVKNQVYAETSYPFRLCGAVSPLLIQPQATQNLLVRISLLETDNINQIMEEITDSQFKLIYNPCGKAWVALLARDYEDEKKHLVKLDHQIEALARQHFKSKRGI